MKLLQKFAIFAAIPAIAITAVWAFAPESIRELRGPLFEGESENAAPLDPNAPTSLIGPIVNTYASAKSFRGDLRSLPQTANQRAMDRPEMGAPSTGTKIASSGPAAKVQVAAPSAPYATSTFPGLDRLNWGAGSPADPNGDVSPTHYIESVNTSVGIFSKAGDRLAAFRFNDFFKAAGVTDACATANYGDPYVIYDRYSSRWFVSDFAFTSTSTGPYYQCIAVSKGSDPVGGGWWAYTFMVSDTQLNDYPKFASWHDGIYMTANLFTGSRYYGAQATVFNREALVSGSPLTSISFVLPYTSTYGYPFSLLASHDASTAATGPEYLYSDWNGLSQWTFTTNWVTPSSSTFSSVRAVANTPSYTSASSSAPQPGTNQALDQLGDRLMTAAQWTNASGSPSVWLARTVAVNGVSGVLWMELKNLGASVSVSQSGVFAPTDGLYRFMPSLAVNSAGTMAVAYSITSSTRYPSLAYAARTKTATSGTIDLGEGSLFAGSGSQTTINRWGDYYSLSVDPADGCSFWMTGSYMAANGGNWQTRISNFAPETCAPVSLPTAALSTTSGAVGSRVTITGTNFLPGATTVSFNGTPATYIAMASSASLTAVVPIGATSGSVTVTNPAGSVGAGPFTVSNSSPSAATLTITKTGLGTVSSNSLAINCGSTCSASFASGSSITLTATPALGSQFTGWSGGCTGTATTCTLTLSASTSVTAAFKSTTTLTYTGPTTASRGQTITLSATLQAGSTGLVGERVTFSLNGKSYSVTTGTNGLASIQLKAPNGKGTYLITVAYAGSPTYAAATITQNLVIQ